MAAPHPLEPKVANAAAVAGQVVERNQAVEMVDGQVGDGFGLGEPQVDGDTAPSVRVNAQAAPAEHAAAGGTEMDFQRRIRLARPRIGGARPEDADALVLVVIGPERPVAAAERAVAGRRGARITLEGPVNGTAMAGACE